MLIYGKIYVKYPKGVHEMTKKSKTLISILLFVVLFGGLLLTATFTDLQVSDIRQRACLFYACIQYTDTLLGCSQILEKTPDKGYC